MDNVLSKAPSVQNSTLIFADAHDKAWSVQAHCLTMAYFEWMNREIKASCSFSIQDIVGMPLAEYVAHAVDTICPDDSSSARFYLLIVNGAAVAMGGIRRLPDGNAEVVRIYTAPQHRGHGYGTLVLKKLMSDAVELGYETIKLDTGLFMKSAHRLYESLGFHDCEAYVGAEPPPELLPYWRFMERSLRSDCLVFAE